MFFSVCAAFHAAQYANSLSVDETRQAMGSAYKLQACAKWDAVFKPGQSVSFDQDWESLGRSRLYLTA